MGAHCDVVVRDGRPLGCGGEGWGAHWNEGWGWGAQWDVGWGMGRPLGCGGEGWAPTGMWWWGMGAHWDVVVRDGRPLGCGGAVMLIARGPNVAPHDEEIFQRCHSDKLKNVSPVSSLGDAIYFLRKPNQ